MPPVFKALSTIMAWILWICALVLGFGSLAMGIIRGDLFGTKAPPMVYAAMFAVAGLYAIIAAVIMLLRKKWNKAVVLIAFLSRRQIFLEEEEH